MDNIDRKKIINRFSRIEGQIRAIKNNLENNEIKDCQDFIIQLKAVRGALRKAGDQFIVNYIQKCQSLPVQKRNQEITKVLEILDNS